MRKTWQAAVASLVLSLILLTACASNNTPPTVNPAQPIPKITTNPAFPNVPQNTFGERPVFLTYPPDGSNRTVVVEQDGLVHILDKNPTTATTFLNLTNQISRNGNEEGLLGLAFHPEYSSNGFFYVYYSAANPRRSVLSRFTASADPNKADLTSEHIILEIPQPHSNHNGGVIVFGPDNYLYIGLGDGGSRFDPDGNGQNLTTLLGTIIRIDVDHPENDLNYGIPADNPFAKSPNGERPEIWAYGIRNPWRFSFDRANGDLWLGDVGQNEWEEIDLIEKGKNYGWNITEGNHCFKPSTNCDPTGTISPVAEYQHPTGCSVTGGYVYRGPLIPKLTGVYVYADFCTGFIWGIRPNGQQAVNPTLIAVTNKQIASFGEDAEGNLYILAFNNQIQRVVLAE